MAITKIWKIKGRIDQVLSYTSDKRKSTNPNFSKVELQGLRDVMNYSCQDYKTEKQQFVSGINCSPETARQKMLITKKKYGKMDGIIAFHACQSFAPGEVTADIAHEIGIKLAKEMWGDRFEVIVATHLDKSHIHNHYVLNSVSFKDGYRYYDNKNNYERLRNKSDKLCEQYRLSVIEDPQKGQRVNYAVHLAEQKGEPTYRSLIRADLDKAIAESLTDKQFFQNLKKMGYEIKIGQDITVKAPGRERGLKLYRNFGEDYTMAAINRRILSQGMPQRIPPPPEPPRPKQMRFTGNIQNRRKITGLRFLYIRYLYILNGYAQHPIQEQKSLAENQVNLIFRDDIRQMHQLSEEMKLLGKNRINTAEQLLAFKEGLEAQMADLTAQRQHLRNETKKEKNEPALADLKAKITGISSELAVLRKRAKLCERISARIARMRENIRKAAEIRANEQNQSQSKGKEQKAYESFRGRRRTSSPHEPGWR